jgi:vacuolar-type H+-ATPase subunit H
MNMRERQIRINKNHQLRPATLRKCLAKAQRIVRKHVTPAVSLADELIAERREEARRESDPS